MVKIPEVFVHWGPRTTEQRRQVVKEITDSIVKNSSNIKAEDVVVIVIEHQRDHMAVGGKLLSDR